ncbi:hypothetical protein BASA81_007774 [Batrachochytrium salamandrivorans]|nr:hypothetical protein BASA81_007774 [Batrachochytrium salamandrivorans]
MITLFMDKTSSNAQPVRPVSSPAGRFSLTRRLSFRRPQSLSLQAFASPPTSPRHAASAQEEKEEESHTPFSLVNRFTGGKKTSNANPTNTGEEEEDSAPRPLLRKRSSNSFAMLFSSPTSSSSASVSRLSSSRELSAMANVQRLARLIPGNRKQFVNELVGNSGDLAAKIRFVDAVDQYLAERDEAKQRKMGKTIRLLFVIDEMFKIRTFAPDTQYQLERERYDYLHIARLEMLAELVLDKNVLAAMDLFDRTSSA